MICIFVLRGDNINNKRGDRKGEERILSVDRRERDRNSTNKNIKFYECIN